MFLMLLLPIQVLPGLKSLSKVYSTTPFKIFGFVFLFVWLIKLLLTNKKIKLYFPELILLFALVTIAMLTSLLFAVNIKNSTQLLFTIFAMSLFVVCFVNVVNDKIFMEQVIIAIVLSGFIMSLVVFYQYLVDPTFMTASGILPDINNPYARLRAGGLVRNVGIWGGYATFFIPFIFSLIYNSRNFLWKTAYSVILIIVALGALFSLSRAAFGGLVIGVILSVFIFERFSAKSMVVLAIIFVLLFSGVGALAGAGFWARMNMAFSGRDGSVLARSSIFHGVMPVFLENPLGVGMGNFCEHVAKYTNGNKFDPHNVYVQILTELGLFGLIIYVLLIGCCFVDLRRVADIANVAGDIKIRNFSIAVQIALVVFLFQSLFDSLLTEKQLFLIVGLTVVMRLLYADKFAVKKPAIRFVLKGEH